MLSFVNGSDIPKMAVFIEFCRNQRVGAKFTFRSPHYTTELDVGPIFLTLIQPDQQVK